MKNAFSYMFKDNMFMNKASAYWAIAFISYFCTQCSNLYAPPTPNATPSIQYILFSIVGFITMFIPCGYGICCIKALMEQRENPVLPFMNIIKSFVIGFKFMLGIFMFLVVLCLFLIIPFLILGILKAIGLGFLVPIISLLLIAFTIIYFIVYSPAFTCLFAKKEWVTTFFKIIRTTKIMKQDLKNYLKYAGVNALCIIALSIINALIAFLFHTGITGALISSVLVSAVGTYAIFVTSHIVAKSLNPDWIE